MEVEPPSPPGESDLGSLLDSRLSSIGLTTADVPALTEAFERSAGLINRARKLTEESFADIDSPIDIIGFGSLARHEFTSASDLDYLVVTYGLQSETNTTRRFLQHADLLRNRLIEGVELNGPGATGVFGRVISAPDMAERIGLEEDTNHSHTRRILLLEESTSLFKPDLHLKLLETIIKRYLYDRVRGRDNVPRFLLNDIVRYWRTITVDYQAKTSKGTAYSLRYLKLLTSRKLTFASSITPLIECQDIAHDAVVDHLVAAYQEPPILRLLRLGRRLQTDEEKNELRSIIKISDKFTSNLGSKDWRDAVGSDCQALDPRETPNFGTARLDGKNLQDHLQNLFTSSSVEHFTKKYLIF
ncbi:DUF294 nucleotidyltransferase-like domain-containing protein [Amycolatopsis rifamycinica]|uniref:DUF294 nucleotidyltransferase-like domain-containing protein n=1 Tax=Amycolatopsis rifamycinica TaxID=287986 RepID=UPI00126A4AE4|nr:DUF294 nucleotidyltransferase-like domain-containing protein [Amycolatopsis rifamycinica]